MIVVLRCLFWHYRVCILNLFVVDWFCLDYELGLDIKMHTYYQVREMFMRFWGTLKHVLVLFLVLNFRLRK